MTSERFIAPSGNLSVAWAQVLLRLLERGVHDLGPVIVTVSDIGADGVPVEFAAIRDLLETHLALNKNGSVQTVANTIFPMGLWQRGVPNEDVQLYARYEAIWPKIRLCRLNTHGVYFRRLTAFRPNDDPTQMPVNQLATIIDNLRNGLRRRSALQAGIFDPTQDHRPTPYLSFPCLQQVAFAPVGEDGLAVTGFYTLQHQFEKAYGNYLGLSRLGLFVGAQVGLRLVQVNCIASAVKIGDMTKSDLKELRDELVPVLAAVTTEGQAQ